MTCTVRECHCHTDPYERHTFNYLCLCASHASLIICSLLSSIIPKRYLMVKTSAANFAVFVLQSVHIQ